MMKTILCLSKKLTPLLLAIALGYLSTKVMADNAITTPAGVSPGATSSPVNQTVAPAPVAQTPNTTPPPQSSTVNQGSPNTTTTNSDDRATNVNDKTRDAAPVAILQPPDTMLPTLLPSNDLGINLIPPPQDTQGPGIFIRILNHVPTTSYTHEINAISPSD